MRPQPTLSDPPIGSEEGLRNDRVRNFIRLMLSDDQDGRQEPGEPILDGPDEEIIIDTEVDGARYLLIRLPKSERAFIQLSPREQEIVRMVSKGHPNKVIADVLNISSWTVCTHLRRIFAKLGVGSRAAMVARLPDIAGARTTVSGPDRRPSSRGVGASMPASLPPAPANRRSPALARSEPALRRNA